MGQIIEKIKNHPLAFFISLAVSVAASGIAVYSVFFPLPIFNLDTPCKNKNEVASFSVKDKNDQRIVDINKLLNEKNCAAKGPFYPKD